MQRTKCWVTAQAPCCGLSVPRGGAARAGEQEGCSEGGECGNGGHWHTPTSSSALPVEMWSARPMECDGVVGWRILSWILGKRESVELLERV